MVNSTLVYFLKTEAEVVSSNKDVSAAMYI